MLILGPVQGESPEGVALVCVPPDSAAWRACTVMVRACARRWWPRDVNWVLRVYVICASRRGRPIGTRELT